jgi:hypothetical protein
MWLNTIFKASRDLSELGRLYPEDLLFQAMERERARADRWEQPLALLSLGVVSAREGKRTLKEAVRILARRLRLTDEAGWLDRRHIGILMPNTPGWGAWTLADEICLEFPVSIPLPRFDVYCYPSDWFRGGGNRLANAAHAPALAGI